MEPAPGDFEAGSGNAEAISVSPDIIEEELLTAA